MVSTTAYDRKIATEVDLSLSDAEESALILMLGEQKIKEILADEIVPQTFLPDDKKRILKPDYDSPMWVRVPRFGHADFFENTNEWTKGQCRALVSKFGGVQAVRALLNNETECFLDWPTPKFITHNRLYVHGESMKENWLNAVALRARGVELYEETERLIEKIPVAQAHGWFVDAALINFGHQATDSEVHGRLKRHHYRPANCWEFISFLVYEIDAPIHADITSIGARALSKHHKEMADQLLYGKSKKNGLVSKGLFHNWVHNTGEAKWSKGTWHLSVVIHEE